MKFCILSAVLACCYLNGCAYADFADLFKSVGDTFKRGWEIFKSEVRRPVKDRRLQGSGEKHNMTTTNSSPSPSTAIITSSSLAIKKTKGNNVPVLPEMKWKFSDNWWEQKHSSLSELRRHTMEHKMTTTESSPKSFKAITTSSSLAAKRSKVIVPVLPELKWKSLDHWWDQQYSALSELQGRRAMDSETLKTKKGKLRDLKKRQKLSSEKYFTAIEESGSGHFGILIFI